MRSDALAMSATRIGGVRHNQRHMVLFTVRSSALCVEPVRAIEITVIGSENNNCVRRKLEGIELVENTCDTAVHIPQAVETERMSFAPTPHLPRRHPADKRVVRLDKIEVSARSPRRVEPLRKAGWQLKFPLLSIQRMRRLPCDLGKDVSLLNFLARMICIVVHHVVRVDEVHGEEPRLVLRCEIRSPAA